MATADDSKLVGDDDQLRDKNGATRENRHFISEAFSFLDNTQDPSPNAMQLSEKDSSSGEETSNALLRRNSHTIRENRHLISDAFSFLDNTQDPSPDAMQLSEKDSSSGEETSNALLRRNSHTIRENRHLISDAFSFLKESDVESLDGILEAGEDGNQVYSNTNDNSKLGECLSSDGDHMYLNNSQDVKGEEIDGLAYENICPDELDRVVKNHNFVSKDTNRPAEDCRSKDSGFASLERNHAGGFKGGEKLELLQSDDANKSISDDENEEEEETEETAKLGSVFYKNRPGNADYTTYVNGTVDQQARTSSSMLNRNASENLYDDLNLSSTSNQPENLSEQPQCINDEVENAIERAAENFSGTEEMVMAKKGEEAFFVTELKSDLAETDKREKVTTCENTYDTFICIDFNKVDLSSGKPRLKPGAPVSNQPTVELSKQHIEETSSNNYDEITEYLTPCVQQGDVMTPSRLGRLARMTSLADEDDDTEEQSEQSPRPDVDMDQAYEYDTITFLNSDNVDAEEMCVVKAYKPLTDDSETGHSKTASNGTMEKSVSSKENCVSESHGNMVGMINREDSQKDEAVLTRKPKLERNLSAEIGSDDSSDEDIGIYAESFRSSNWIRIGEEGKLEFTKGSSAKSTVSSHSPSSSSRSSTSSSSASSKSSAPAPHNSLPGLSSSSGKSENLEDIKEDALPVSPRDDVFLDPLSESVRRQKLLHKRSEKEFKHQYVSRRKCLIQRADSQQEYHRLSARVYDQDKQVLVQRSSNDDDLGLHLLDSHPAFITSVDPGSPADMAGIQEGQILVSVNDLNVLTTDHDDIVNLIQSCEGSVRLGVATSDFQPVRDLQAAAMSGFMYKLGNSSFMRMWKKRYFILRQDNCLYYYKSDQDNHDPLGAVPLCGYTILRHTETSKDYCFKAEKYGARTYFFMTDNRDQLTDWVRALTEAAARSKRRKESFLSVSSHNVGLPALDIRRPECSGNLMKLKPTNRSWCKRYCVLKDACMYYYKDVNSLRALGVAHLHGYKVDAKNHPRKKHSFSLQPPESKMRSFHFAADNETDKKRWVETLIHSIQRWVRVDREAEC